MSHRWLVGVLVMLALTIVGCESSAAQERSATLRVVATTSIVGDVVRQVGGDRIDLTVLMAPGQDPHSYEATAQDLRQVERADIVFVNGFDFEEALIGQISTIATGEIIALSSGIEPLVGTPHAHEGEGEDDHHDEGLPDPHVWWDVENVRRWTQTAAAALVEADPANAETYRADADRYDEHLNALNEEIGQQIATIPVAQRLLVTTHGTMATFAHAYRFRVVGTVMPGFSTGAEPSAQALETLRSAIMESGARAIFVENTVNDATTRVVADEVGVPVYALYTDALGPPGSGADSYIGFMRTNVATIVGALGR